MPENPQEKYFKYGYIVLGILSAIGMAGYGIVYLAVMPQVSPDSFVPTMLENSNSGTEYFGMMQPIFVLLYAFAFLPVTIMFTIKRYRKNPYALVFTACLIGISSLIEILNNLPLLTAAIYPMKLETVPPDILLYLTQMGAIRFLSYDVAGFSLIYVAFFIYAVIYYRSHKWLMFAIIVSIVLFIINVPFLWFIPNMAIILMVLSIFAMAPFPVFLAKEAIQ